jgi:uncharacterized protein (UPF0147 family)
MILQNVLAYSYFQPHLKGLLTTWAKIQIYKPVSKDTNLPHHGRTYISDAVWIAL